MLHASHAIEESACMHCACTEATDEIVPVRLPAGGSSFVSTVGGHLTVGQDGVSTSTGNGHAAAAAGSGAVAGAPSTNAAAAAGGTPLAVTGELSTVSAQISKPDHHLRIGLLSWLADANDAIVELHPQQMIADDGLILPVVTTCLLCFFRQCQKAMRGLRRPSGVVWTTSISHNAAFEVVQPFAKGFWPPTSIDCNASLVQEWHNLQACLQYLCKCLA